MLLNYAHEQVPVVEIEQAGAGLLGAPIEVLLRPVSEVVEARVDNEQGRGEVDAANETRAKTANALLIGAERTAPAQTGILSPLQFALKLTKVLEHACCGNLWTGEFVFFDDCCSDTNACRLEFAFFEAHT
jgi:hypothetical protein